MNEDGCHQKFAKFAFASTIFFCFSSKLPLPFLIIISVFRVVFNKLFTRPSITKTMWPSKQIARSNGVRLTGASLEFCKVFAPSFSTKEIRTTIYVIYLANLAFPYHENHSSHLDHYYYGVVIAILLSNTSHRDISRRLSH